MTNWLKSLLIIILLLTTCPMVTAEVYKWVDDNGVSHFSDTPPENVDLEGTVEKSFSSPPPANVETENIVKKPSLQKNPKPFVTDSQKTDMTESKKELDLQLRSIWAIMRENLKNKNIEGALQYFIPTERARYKRIFLLIEKKVPGGISAEAEKLPDPVLIKIEKDKVTYILKRKESGKYFEYPLVFVKDIFFTGQWKIYEY